MSGVVQTPAFEASKRLRIEAPPVPINNAEQIVLMCKEADFIISIDGGGSKTILQVLNSKMQPLELEYHGKTAQSVTVGGTNINIVGLPATKQVLEDLLAEVKVGDQKLPLKDLESKAVICGMAGLVSASEKAPQIRALFGTFGFKDESIFLGGDVELAKLLISESGAILISGTGSICFSKVAGKGEQSLGGLGYLLGDEGSGFYVGKLVLRAALQAIENGEPFVLTEKICKLFNIASINEIFKLVYNDGQPKPGEVAKIAPLVFEEAFKQKQADCMAIIDDCATELAKLVTGAVANSEQADFPIYLIGGIFKSEFVDEFIEMIRQKVDYSPGLKFINVAVDNVAVHVALTQSKVSQASKLTLAAGGTLYAYENYAHRHPRNLNAALDYYGFKAPEQKQALRFLMQKAGIKDADALLDRKAENQEALIRSVLDLVRETQNKFTIRTDKQERWDVQTSDWMKDPAQQGQVLSALATLKMMDALPPKFKRRDVICILGASRSVMVSRLEYAGNLFVENKLPAHWLVMLAGERYVTPDKNGVQVDGSEKELSELAAKMGKNVSTLTETDLMKAAYEASKLYGKFPNRDVLIDTPRRNLLRPTTETTVTELCEWLKQHPEVHEITFVSNQPHVEYQKAIIAQVFEKQRVTVSFEVIGSEFTNTPVKSTEDQINYLMQALGSRIWAVTPKVMDAIGLDMSDPKLRAEYMELYNMQPLIYNNLDAKLPKPKI